jgi:hypothetical protein
MDATINRLTAFKKNDAALRTPATVTRRAAPNSKNTYARTIDKRCSEIPMTPNISMAQEKVYITHSARETVTSLD